MSQTFTELRKQHCCLLQVMIISDFREIHSFILSKFFVLVMVGIVLPILGTLTVWQEYTRDEMPVHLWTPQLWAIQHRYSVCMLVIEQRNWRNLKNMWRTCKTLHELRLKSETLELWGNILQGLNGVGIVESTLSKKRVLTLIQTGQGPKDLIKLEMS